MKIAKPTRIPNLTINFQTIKSLLLTHKNIRKVTFKQTPKTKKMAKPN